MGETNTRLGFVSPRMVMGLWLSTTPVALSCAPPMILIFAPLVKFRSIGRPRPRLTWSDVGLIAGFRSTYHRL